MSESQGFLFGQPSPKSRAVLPARVSDEVRELGAKLPRRLHLGTSSWSFPGWAGIVYESRADEASHRDVTLAERGLSAYAAHPVLRSVGVDRAFYRPPSVASYESLASQTPPNFRFLVKAYQGLTRPYADGEGRTHGLAGGGAGGGGNMGKNALFLDDQYAAEQVVKPAFAGLGARCGVIVFQFPPIEFGDTARQRQAGLTDEGEFLERLEAFLLGLRSRLGEAVPVALGVELRSDEVLNRRWAGRYAGLLARTGCVHVYAAHPSMRGVVAQEEALGAAALAGPCVVRWMLRSNHRYEEAKDFYAPFNALAEPDGAVRGQVVDVVTKSLRQEKDCIIIINNKAEGSAPLSCIELGKAIVSGGV